MLIILDTA